MADHPDDLALRWFESLRRHSPRPTRRAVLRAALGFAAYSLALPLSRAQPRPRPRFSGAPFTLGVASGYPRPDGVVLWTRLAPEPLDPDGGMAYEKIDVAWEVAEDESFRRIVRSGTQRATPELAHSVRVEVDGLDPARWYFYRFHAGDETSAIGRTRTAPAVDADAPLKLAFASCQHFEHGYFAGHRHLLGEDLDLMLFLGDYIYEGSWGSLPIRRHAPGGDALALGDYRMRHAQYKTDRDLQALHAHVPWLLTWDDHEVDNDYGGDVSEHLDPQFFLRRAAAYQAYYEHMPLPRAMLPAQGDARIYTHVDFGRSARIYLVDNRQYRSAIACPRAGEGGSRDAGPECPEMDDPARTLLGAQQERWLGERFADSRARWNVLAQQTLFAPLDKTKGEGVTRGTDYWDGYSASRARVLAALAQHQVRNPIAIGGDLHANVFANVHADPRDPSSPVAVSEFCGTSIASEGWPKDHWAQFRPDNPHIVYTEDEKRGYVTLELGAKQCRAQLRSVDDATRRDSGIATTAEFVVEEGRPGVVKA